MSARKTHNRNNSSNLIGIPLTNALRSMGASQRDSYIKRTLNPGVDDLKETLILREKEKEQIIEKTESKWLPFFSHINTEKDFNNLIEAMAEDVKRDTKYLDTEIEYIQKQLNGRGAVQAKSAKIDQENPQGKKSKGSSSFGLLRKFASSLVIEQEPKRTSTTSLNKTSSSKSSNKSASKILRNTNILAAKEMISPTSPTTNRSRFAK